MQNYSVEFLESKPLLFKYSQLSIYRTTTYRTFYLPHTSGWNGFFPYKILSIYRGPANQANNLPTAVHFSERFGTVPEAVGIHLNAQYQGKLAFFDSSKGLFYDGQGQLYLYQSDNTSTAIESSVLQPNPLGVGNFSLYLLEREHQSLF
ncbi:hypothetical protein Ddc_14994 [Ditylenchus destructor]|nr:hypothetical protein Ddc_14994 [Ditylenchus destructor]